MSNINICREPVYYTAGFGGLDVEQAPLYLQALAFDGRDNEYGARLISRFNQRLAKDYPQHCLPAVPIKQLPHRIIIIDAASEQSPLSYETRRIWEAYIYREGWDCITRIVNSQRELLQQARAEPEHALIFSQCGNREVYDIKLCQQLMKLGAAVVPGLYTAPGGVADKTHISGSPEGWRLVAHYRLGRGGIVLESMYGREQPQPSRLLPLKPWMVEAIGGDASLHTALLKGVEILIGLVEQSPAADRCRIPLRLQVGLVPPDQSLSEVNGDPARGLCLATRWSDLVNHTLEWLEDGLGYYNWRGKQV